MSPHQEVHRAEHIINNNAIWRITIVIIPYIWWMLMTQSIVFYSCVPGSFGRRLFDVFWKYLLRSNPLTLRKRFDNLEKSWFCFLHQNARQGYLDAKAFSNVFAKMREEESVDGRRSIERHRKSKVKYVISPSHHSNSQSKPLLND